MKTYTVTITKRYPAWDERDGIRYYGETGRSKAEVIAKVRRMARDDGHTGPGCGHASFKAEEEQA